MIMAKRRNYEELPDIELPEEQVEIINKFIDQAEKDLEEARVNFRWGTEQIELVKKVAKLMGVPYQTYIKQVVYRQCLQDLKDAETVNIKKIS
jgi:predicted DNA binding CopG/RHH family protein